MLELEGKQTYSPKESLKQAYQLRWIDHEQVWLDMLKDRSQTSHTYDQDLAAEIYENIQNYYPEMRKTYDFLVEHLSDGEGE